MIALANAKKAWLLRGVKLVLVALLAWFIGRAVQDAWGQLAQGQWQFGPLWLEASGVLYLVGLLPSAFFWYRSLRGMGQQPRLGQTLRAYFIGHLGKYVPGKALVIVLRAGLVRGNGVSTTVAAVSVFYETLTTMAVGGAVAAALLWTWFPGQRLFVFISLGSAAVAVAPTLPGVFPRLARLVGVGRDDPAVLAQVRRLGYGSILLGWLMISAGWAVIGLSLWATLRGMGALADGQPPHPLWHLPLCTAAVSLATVAGFLSFLPGGALVREGVLIALLPLAGFTTADAVIAAVLLRLVWLAAELVICGVVYFQRPSH